MRIQVAVPEAHVDRPVLDSALEAVTRLNQSMLGNGEVIPFDRALKRFNIKWQPEPPGQEHFDHAKTVIARGWGDCDDLAPYHAASLRHSGEDPKAKAIVYKSGPQRWHAVVQRGDGTIDDPSLRAGMPGPKGRGRGARAPHVAPMPTSANAVVGAYIVRPQIAMRPVYGQFQARADLPWHWREHLELDKPTDTDYAMTSLHTSPVASTALVGAICGALKTAHAADAGDPDHLDQLAAIADYIEGVDPDEIADAYGDEKLEKAQAVVGSFWGSLGRIVKKTVAPIASKVVQFVPGVGPVASTAIDLAASAIPSGGGRPAPAPVPAPVIQPAFAAPASAVRQAFGPPGQYNQRLCIPVSFG